MIIVYILLLSWPYFLVGTLCYYKPLMKWFEMEDIFQDPFENGGDMRPVLVFLSPLVLLLVLLLVAIQIRYLMCRSREQKHRDLLKQSGNELNVDGN